MLDNEGLRRRYPISYIIKAVDDTKIVESLTKSVGCVISQYVKCGKSTCKCVLGDTKGHGPYYYYRYWKIENGKYVRKKLYIDYVTYERLKTAIEIYTQTLGGYHGNFGGTRKSLLQSIQSGNKPTDEALRNFEVTIDTVLNLV